MPSQANAAIYYVPDGYSWSAGGKLMGRQAAGAGFLKAFAASGVDHFYCYAPNQQSVKGFTETVHSVAGPRPVTWIHMDRIQEIGKPGCLYVPGPSLAEYAHHRARFGDRSFSLCGVTHTTASHSVMEAIGNMLTDPVRSWDAVICTSRAVRDSVKYLLEKKADYLRWRVGATRFDTPQLPVIPLGVDCEQYRYDAGQRAAARAALGIAEDEIAVLFVGRLSFHAKAHPLPMYLGLERAARGRKVRLIQVGWFANEYIERAFRDGAQELCPSVGLTFLDGRIPEELQQGWAAADIFTSLSDNIQETFGLTPIEAMAAGLPVVVTDWDGYKDTVRDGVDGFRVPTLMPPEPGGQDLADRHSIGIDNYDMYCGHTSQIVAVDVAACERAYAYLIDSPELRRKMGEAGRERARSLLDWSVVIGRYRELWDELAERRRADAELGPARLDLIDPARPDPMAVFGTYPTYLIEPGHIISLVQDDAEATLDRRRKLTMVSFAKAILPPEAECRAIIDFLRSRGPCAVGELARLGPAARGGRHLRTLAWLAKLDIVRILPPGVNMAAAP